MDQYTESNQIIVLPLLIITIVFVNTFSQTIVTLWSPRREISLLNNHELYSFYLKVSTLGIRKQEHLIEVACIR